MSRKVIRRKILAVKIFWPKNLINIIPARFSALMAGQRIKRIGRRAKILIIELDRAVLLIHLKMTGQLLDRPSGAPLEKHLLAVFDLTGGRQLRFNDIRRFGYIKYFPSLAAARKELSSLGPEPLEKSFTARVLAESLGRKKKSKIKQALMDPQVVAGIGNIYSDEILHLARVHPLRRAGTLKPGEITAIWQAIKKILPLAISRRGSSVNNYVNLDGRPGGFAPYLKVYGREGEKCSFCRGPIKRIKIGGRSAYFCPSCQK